MKVAVHLLLYIVLSFLMVTGICKGHAHSQGILDKEVTLNLVDAYPVQVMRFLSKNYNIYTGIETIMYDDNQPGKKFIPINIKCVKCSVGKVLNQFISTDDRYLWIYTEGVINVLPKDQDDRISDTYIKNVQIKQKNIDEIINRIFEIPELIEVIRGRSLTPLMFMSSGILGVKGNEAERVWLSQEDTILAKVLNELIKKEGTKNWSIYKTKGRFGSITLAL